MSKTVAKATISTQCGFTNGAGGTVTFFGEKISAKQAAFFGWIRVMFVINRSRMVREGEKAANWARERVNLGWNNRK